MRAVDAFGVFHALAVASLVTIAVGLLPLLLGKWSPLVIATHAYCMTWSYAGLVAAGCGQLAVAVGLDSPAWVVPLVIATDRDRHLPPRPFTLASRMIRAGLK